MSFFVVIPQKMCNDFCLRAIYVLEKSDSPAAFVPYSSFISYLSLPMNSIER
jgi:hypothetical protein